LPYKALAPKLQTEARKEIAFGTRMHEEGEGFGYLLDVGSQILETGIE